MLQISIKIFKLQ